MLAGSEGGAVFLQVGDGAIDGCFVSGAKRPFRNGDYTLGTGDEVEVSGQDGGGLAMDVYTWNAAAGLFVWTSSL